MTKEELLNKAIGFMTDFPYDEYITFFMVVRESCGLDEAIKADKERLCDNLMSPFFRECKSRGIFLKRKNNHGVCVGRPSHVVEFMKLKNR